MRNYRNWINTEDLVSFEVREKQTDLFVLADRVLDKEVRDSVVKHRKDIEGYISKYPDFKNSLEPIEADSNAPDIVKAMLGASIISGVGPMAGVAGAIAEYVGKDLMKFSKQVIVENGGDIFLRTDKERILGIFAGESKFTKRIGLKIKPQKASVGICTSSGKIGHSLSFGMTDATVVMSKDTILSDCMATRIGNLVKGTGDIQRGIDFAKSIRNILGVIVIIGDRLGSWGKIELVNI